MRLVVIFSLLALAGILYFALFSSTPPAITQKSTAISADDKAKAEAEAMEKEKAEADAKAKAQAKAEAKAEAEALEKEKAMADAKAKAQAEAIEKGKIELANAIESKKKSLADCGEQIKEASNALAALGQKPVEEAALGQDKERAVELKKSKSDAIDAFAAAKAKWSSAQSAAVRAADSLKDSRSKSEYSGWRYVGDSTAHSMAELGSRDKKRRIEYISGGKSTAQDAAIQQASQAASAAKADYEAAAARKDATIKAYDDFAISYKAALTAKIKALKDRHNAESQEFAGLKEKQGGKAD